VERSVDLETVPAVPVAALFDQSEEMSAPSADERCVYSLLSGLDIAFDLSLFVVEHGQSDLCQNQIYPRTDSGSLFKRSIDRWQGTFLSDPRISTMPTRHSKKTHLISNLTKIPRLLTHTLRRIRLPQRLLGILDLFVKLLQLLFVLRFEL
jgi:hypothetical protein